MKRLMALAMVTALIGAAEADPARAENVMFGEVLERALVQNRLLAASMAEGRAAESEHAAVRGRYFPSLSLQENFGASDAPTRVFMMKLDQGRFAPSDLAIRRLNNPSSETDFTTEVTLSQPLLDFSILADLQAADLQSRLAAHAVKRTQEEVVLDVVGSALMLKRAKAAVAAGRKGVEEAREHLRVAAARTAAGTGLKSDELRARAFLSERESALVSAENAVTVARMRLAIAAGGAPGDSLDITDEVILPVREYSLDQLRELAPARRPDLQETGIRTALARAGVRQAEAAFLPALNLSAGYAMHDRTVPFGRDDSAWWVGAGLRWELFDGLSRWNRRAKAQALAEAAEQVAARRQSDVAVQVTDAYLRRDAALKRLEAAYNALADAEEAVRLVAKRFDNSLATIVDLLDVQAAADRARGQVVEQEAAAQLALAELYHSAGILGREVVR